MANYRIKPAVVQAIPVFEVIEGYKKDPKRLPQWVQDAYERGDILVLIEDILKCGGVIGTEQDMLVNNSGEISIVWENKFFRYYELA